MGPVNDMLEGFSLTMGESAVCDIVTSLIQKSFPNYHLQKKRIFDKGRSKHCNNIT